MRWLRPFELLLFVAAPLACIARDCWFVDGNGGGHVFWVFHRAAYRIARGDSPYRAATVHVIGHGSSYVYAEPFAYLFVPFTWVPYRYGAVAFMLLSALAVGFSIRLLGARDWRVYGAAILTYPVFGALELGAIGPLLLLFVAAGWRYRDRAAGGVFLALAAAVKLFLWPVLVWLVVTRRLRGSLAAAATLVAVLGIWLLTDRHGLREYPAILRVLNHVFRGGSYSPQALALSLGTSPAVAAGVSTVLAVLGVGVIVFLRRRERDAFAAAVIVSILATPILWMHYLVLLIVPLVLLNPSLSLWWLALIPLWATPQYQSHGDTWRLLLTLSVVVVIASAPLWRRVGQPEPTDHAALA